MGQGGWIHSPAANGDEYIARPNIFEEINISLFRDGPAGNGSDTYVDSLGHGFEDGDKIIINGSTIYDNSGNTLTVSDVTDNRFSITTNYTAEDPLGTARIADVNAASAKSSDPLFYYDMTFFLGMKCLGTNPSGDGDSLLRIQLEPLDTNLIDQSKADTPGDVLDFRLQSGQSVFGAFRRIRIHSATNSTILIYKG